MTYYLQDNPNPFTPQYGWERAKLGQPGQHLSGVVGVHTSEAPTDFEGPDFNAENNAAFIARRTDYGSYTTTADYDSILPLVHPRYAAWADTTNNAHALSVSGCLQASRWMEMTPERRDRVTINMGIAIAREVLVAVNEGYLAAPPPAVRISATDAISGRIPGFYGHGETNPGTRYDPGAHFNWTLFLSAYAQAVGNPITEQEDDMDPNTIFISKDGAKVTFQTLLNSIDGKVDGLPKFDAQVREQFSILNAFNRDVRAALAQSKAREETANATNAALVETVAALAAGKDDIDSDDILARVESVVSKYASTWTLKLEQEAPAPVEELAAADATS